MSESDESTKSGRKRRTDAASDGDERRPKAKATKPPQAATQSRRCRRPRRDGRRRSSGAEPYLPKDDERADARARVRRPSPQGDGDGLRRRNSAAQTTKTRPARSTSRSRARRRSDHRQEGPGAHRPAVPHPPGGQSPGPREAPRARRRRGLPQPPRRLARHHGAPARQASRASRARSSPSSR